MDFHASEKPAPKGVRSEDFEESDIKDLAGLLPGVARDDGLPRLMGGYLIAIARAAAPQNRASTWLWMRKSPPLCWHFVRIASAMRQGRTLIAQR
jgi:hypothetical protein